jgi:predicted nucleic acid-binding protein
MNLITLALEYHYTCESYDRTLSDWARHEHANVIPKHHRDGMKMSNHALRVLTDILRREALQPDDLLPTIRKTADMYPFEELERLFGMSIAAEVVTA